MIWLSSVLFLLLPLSLAASGYFAGREMAVNSGNVLLRFVKGLSVIFIIALATLWLLPQPDASVNLIQTSFVNLVMLGLVLFMAVVLVAFSRNYLAGEARVGFYWRWLLNTLAAVALVVISNHLALFWLGWVGISLALHKLLTFYPDRPRAVLAAHKKFLLARTAETLLLIAFILLATSHNTLMISELLNHFYRVANSDLTLGVADQIAAVLIALVAIIKCAQLPVHGWLMQVVEAPTPVSALLHAGVINLGGFLLILFAPLFGQAGLAQWLVLIVAGVTTVLAALIMTTRISVKVRLAWSTNAQMGLMLLECALGLYELALLHLLTHSAYKAHAFLNAGSAVYDDMRRRLSPAGFPTLNDWVVAAAISGALVTFAMILSNEQGAISVWVLFGLALTTLIAHRKGHTSTISLKVSMMLAMGLTASYLVMKALVGYGLMPSESFQSAMFSAADIWALLLFLALFLISGFLRLKAETPAMQRLSVALFAGLYLDEWLTRLTLKVWPVRLPASERTPSELKRTGTVALTLNNVKES